MGTRKVKWAWLLLLMVPVLVVALFLLRPASYWTGANVKMSADAPWGSPAARESMARLAHAGASVAMQVAFAWQPTPESDTPVLGADSQPDVVRAGLKDIKAAGLEPILKIHLWIPWHWAGQVAPAHPALWFRNYARTILPLVAVAREEGVATIVIATELRGVEKAEGWPDFVKTIRAAYPGHLAYDADNPEQAEAFQHWDLFDVITTSLYTALPDDRPGRLRVMRDTAGHLRALGQRWQRPVWVAELGLRSGQGVLSRPWMSPEELKVPVDLNIQRDVLEDWRTVLVRHGVRGISFWCWYTDPRAGGPDDSDFTLQNKPGEAVLKK
ncbi:glycoside hydrolase family 113 [Gluconacetobacter diazotrophicus]|nr:hypothetical protein [Gluconacetobacter diazotrophicus]